MKRIIITTGPSYLNDNILKKNHQERYIYRINGSHGSVQDIEKTISEIRKQIKNADILIDLPGNKIRTANIKIPIEITLNKIFVLKLKQINFPDFYKYIKKGDVVYANDSIYTFKIKEINKDSIEFISLSNGKLENNKGLHVRGINKTLPFLLKKDLDIIKIANRNSIKFLGLSFVRNVDDINEAKKLIKKSIIISKIETAEAVKNLTSILNSVEYILIDRGDLSTDVGLIKIPYYQRHIIEKALSRNKKVFLATQFLKTMENMPIPTIAEVVDLTNTLKQGIHGIQLSEETAIGQYPLECLNLIEQIEKNVSNETI
ncbi:MAG: pyruvate kinase [bacterium]|nr:pyruvate kinase [bacterium]